jgi:AAA+ ATPase superfamily predicted ATPase
METPFVFGRIASAQNFTNRKKETERLVLNFSSSVNTILISPRRWGKSSLVKHATEINSRKNKGIRFCFIDLNNVRTEEQFYQYYATAVLRSSARKAKELLEDVSAFLGRFIPNVTLSPGTGTEFKLGMDWKEVKRDPDDVLNLAEKIAAKKKIKFIVCIDEFQNIAGFENPLDFQKKLRSHWQKHNAASYCLYGSKRHMMMEVFTSPSMPFYKFGDIIFLEKISVEDWMPFIRKRFAETGKKIKEDEARLITELADSHPYYVQQLAQQSWFRTEKECSNEIINMAFTSLVLQLSMLFQNLTDGISNTQVNFLKALVNGEEQLSSQNTILEYGLGTSGNVLKIKKMLIYKEIIDIENGRITFLDPLYKAWLMAYYFRK